MSVKVSLEDLYQRNRINIGIRAEFLSDEHLLEEVSYIGKIPDIMYELFESGALLEQHPVLDKKTAAFFFDKQHWLLDRYYSTYWECMRRGYKIPLLSSKWLDSKQFLTMEVQFKTIGVNIWKNYTVTPKDLFLSQLSFKERLKSIQYHYSGIPIFWEDIYNLLRFNASYYPTDTPEVVLV